MEIAGKTFGRWTVISFSHRSKNGDDCWRCRCSCGKTRAVIRYSLVTGESRSCGCLQREVNIKRSTKHGLCGTRFYTTWANILSRCNYKKSGQFKDYGGRGIRCLWTSFEEFKNDMYKSYVEHSKKFGEKNTTIDRVDNDGNYSRNNCRWATYRENMNNKRRHRFIIHDGIKLTVAQWARKIGVQKHTLYKRLDSGWNSGEILGK